ncbi:hypothetical protein Kpol_376p2 [Vanderwaltozyma polyspora DSM 70294]|uniref:Mitochondrial import inner membrane translocase subunit n=1 Tax=Vanderwaltozyma polyspora (strain ATCC 22028 / DSM 70294 / BCRC 21397 / CBS 2163 / NBRC 10782 / NRRL Y-8283 / UCD 57-17) TaxID=436907 RepID=A7TRV2_VANPO|nr:uncharacterized protein Kpol_376p2 [Vanderwaltozyma polyspora DSM 70294]EDO14989.1 hypothetical protein Kpol_376p2 [Vanderwaltozyma polyspora DSM 70294]
MSYFFNPSGGQEVSEERLKVAEVQFDAMNQTFNNILKGCLEKCIPHEGYGETELNKGEMECIDRCVAKLHYSNRLIGAYAQTQGFGPEKYLPHYDKMLSKTDDQ